MTTTATKTTKINDKTVRVTLERGIWVEMISLDGMECGTREHVIDRYEIALIDTTGKVLANGDNLSSNYLSPEGIKAGCDGRVGSKWHTKPATTQAIRQMMAELDLDNPKTAEQIAIETAKANAEAQHTAYLNSKEYREAVEFERKMSDPNSDL